MKKIKSIEYALYIRNCDFDVDLDRADVPVPGERLTLCIGDNLEDEVFRVVNGIEQNKKNTGRVVYYIIAVKEDLTAIKFKIIYERLGTVEEIGEVCVVKK
jgi:hypothetical protein